MPYDLSIYIPKRVLYCHVYGEYTLAEMRESNQKIIDYLNQQVTAVHVISDFVGMTNLNHDLPMLVKTFSFFAHAHQGWSIVISPDPIIRVISTAVVQQVKQADVNVTMRAFEDRQTALAFLTRIDLTLPPLPRIPLDVSQTAQL